MFLDEIGEMTPALQAKLLRFLEEKTFKRVGGVADIRVDVRVIAATNRNLEEEVEARAVPRGPLLPAERPADRAAAAARARRTTFRRWSHFYVDSFNREFRKRVRGVAPDAMRRARDLRLAGQRPRAAQRRRARDAARRGRRADARRLPDR